MAELELKSGTVSETWLPNDHFALCLRPKQKIRNELLSHPSSSPQLYIGFKSLCFNCTAVDFSGPNWSPSLNPYTAVWVNDVKDSNQIQNTHVLHRTEIALSGGTAELLDLQNHHHLEYFVRSLQWTLCTWCSCWCHWQRCLMRRHPVWKADSVTSSILI